MRDENLKNPTKIGGVGKLRYALVGNWSNDIINDQYKNNMKYNIILSFWMVLISINTDLPFIL